MLDGLIDRLLQLTGRERVLLAVTAVIVLPALVWMMLVTPMQERHRSALQAAGETQALALWVLDRAAEQVQLNRGGGPTEPIGISGLEQSLVQAGLRRQLRQLGGAGDGRIGLRFEAVVFTDLMDWLSRSEPDWGYDIIILQVHRSETAGLVAADLTLQPQS